ncbi:hypothetical protein Q7O_001382 [Pectobacterium carotovorum subsp. carotovorum PCCS1]|nr:Gfo/Idh/MocA family oxidoreductase [Pectobacterium aroidearum]MBG0751936.1 hypothetical protein [Pectobacterium carotovorum subsp. carotovorum PCCS1]
MSKMPTLKLGVIGGGLNSAIGTTHKIASQMDGRFELVSGCFSRNAAINKATAESWGVSLDRLYTSQTDFLDAESKKLDAVLILTPTPTHADIIISCFECGLPVICEKALVSNIDEVEKLSAAIEAQKGTLIVTFNYTGYPMLRELRQRIAEGELGIISQVMIEMPQEGFLRRATDGKVTKPQSWRQKDGSIPTVSLDLGVHVHQMVDFLIREKAQNVFAFNSTFGEVPNVIDTVHCVARYSTDVICNYWYGKAAPGYRNGLRVRVFGNKGSAEWLQMDPEYLHISDVYGGSFRIDRTHPENRVANLARYCRFKAGHPAGFIEAFANYYEDIADMLSGTPNDNVFGLDVARDGIIFLHNANISAVKGTPVSLI